MAEPIFISNNLYEEWKNSRNSLVFGKIKCMLLVFKHLELLTPSVKYECKKFKVVTLLFFISVISVMAFAFIGYRVCG